MLRSQATQERSQCFGFKPWDVWEPFANLLGKSGTILTIDSDHQSMEDKRGRIYNRCNEYLIIIREQWCQVLHCACIQIF